MNGLEAMEKINMLKETLESWANYYIVTNSEETLNKMGEITKEIIELKEKLSKVTI